MTDFFSRYLPFFFLFFFLGFSLCIRPIRLDFVHVLQNYGEKEIEQKEIAENDHFDEVDLDPGPEFSHVFSHRVDPVPCHQDKDRLQGGWEVFKSGSTPVAVLCFYAPWKQLLSYQRIDSNKQQYK